MSETPRSDIERDGKLDALYRAAARDEPPPALDAAIRAAARRAVASRPRLAGSPFSRSWGVPLSIAAVVLLSVTLVTLIGEEGPPAITQPPRAEAPPADAERKPAADQSAAVVPRTLMADEQRSTGIGLKPPQQASAPGLGMRSNSAAPEPVVQPRKDMAEADRVAAAPPSAPPLLAKRAPPEAFPGAAEVSDSKVAAPAEKARQSAKEEARRDVAASAGAERPQEEAKAPLRSETASADSAMRESGRARVQAVPAPAAKPAPPPAPQMAGAIQAYANLPPVKWLEQIESLRKQGRLEEARTSFAEFRKRHPDYPLPDSLKDWARP